MSDWGLIMSEDRRHVSVILPDGRAVAEYTVDHEGRRVEPMTEHDRLRLRHRIAVAATDLLEAALAGEELTPAEHSALATLVIRQSEMALKGL